MFPPLHTGSPVSVLYAATEPPLVPPRRHDDPVTQQDRGGRGDEQPLETTRVNRDHSTLWCVGRCLE